MTCIEVDECAGSTPRDLRSRGSVAPNIMEKNTMEKRLRVMARVSGRGTLKSMARMKPAVESRTARVHDVASSEWREEAMCEGVEGILKKR